MPQEVYNTRIGKKLLYHAGTDATNRATAFFDDNTITLCDPTRESSITIKRDFGIGIQGPVSFICSPDQIRVAGAWKVNPLVITSLPSTIYTPIPWLRQSMPTSSKEIAAGLYAIAGLFSGL